jgi:RNA polymerase sigma-70 factor (ECF subfamily)
VAVVTTLSYSRLPMSPDEVGLVIARGAEVHPGVGEPPELRARLAELPGDKLLAHAGDIYLAAACAAGDAAAIAKLDALLPEIVHPALARLRVPASDYSEIVQRVRVALLAPSGDREPGIAGYRGRGVLRAYVRSVAARLAITRIQRETAPNADDPGELMALLPDSGDSAELKLLKQRYRADLRRAFAEAFAALAPRDRTLLRQHYLDGLTVDQLAPLHRVHRATCARWVEGARTKVLRDVRRRLHASLGLDERELDRAVDLVRSQLDLSLSRNLG